MPLHPRTCSVLYSVSCLLDALDGVAARRFEQSTKFGAVLDMVTDRCTTSCLLVFLASAFPRWSLVFQLLISIDFASHYMHMYATLAMGGSSQSHKKIEKGRSWVLTMYYSDNVRLASPLSKDSESFVLRHIPLLDLREDHTDPRIRSTENTICLLRPERALFHRNLPTILLFTHLIPFAAEVQSRSISGERRELLSIFPMDNTV